MHTQSLLATAQKQWVKQAEVKLPYIAYSVRVINQQLWCCCWEDGIVVLAHSDLKQLRTIPAGDMGSVNDVVEMRDGDIVIATDNGLFHVRISQCGKDCISIQQRTNLCMYHQNKSSSSFDPSVNIMWKRYNHSL